VPGLMIIWEAPCEPSDEQSKLISVFLNVERRVRRAEQDLREKEWGLKAIAGMPGEPELSKVVGDLRRQVEGDQAEYKVLRDRSRVLDEDIEEIRREAVAKVNDLMRHIDKAQSERYARPRAERD